MSPKSIKDLKVLFVSHSFKCAGYTYTCISCVAFETFINYPSLEPPDILLKTISETKRVE